MSEANENKVEEIKVEGTGATTPEEAITVSKPRKWIKWAIGGVVAVVTVIGAAVFGLKKNKDDDNDSNDDDSEKTETED